MPISCHYVVMINLLSSPQKMPCNSFNIPAMLYCPAAKLIINAAKKAGKAIDDLICSHCYALKGSYLFSNVKKALQAKADLITKSLREDNGDTFVETMVSQITAKYYKNGEKKSLKNCNTDLFRVHDSGDLFSKKYIECWIRICQALPDIRFWFPTREYVRIDQLPHLRKLAELPNAIVRPSALKVDEPAPKIAGLDGGTSVYTSEEKAKADGHMVCPATVHPYRMGKKAWSALDKKKRGELASCAGNNCQACFIKSCKPKAYLAH